MITVRAKESEADLSKRYLKYLSKKYLKKQSIRDFVRVVASAKNSYELRLFKLDKEEEEQEE